MTNHLITEIESLNDYASVRTLNCLVRQSSTLIDAAGATNPGELESLASNLLEEHFPDYSAGLDVAHATYDAQRKGVAVRALLSELATTPEPSTQRLLEQCIEKAEADEPEPAEVSLLLIGAGIVLLLQTRFGFELAREGGKTKFRFQVSKKQTSEGLIGKILSPFIP